MAVLLNVISSTVQSLQMQIFQLFLLFYVFKNKVVIVKSHHSISVKWARYRDTGPTDPSLIEITKIKLTRSPT